MAKEVKIYNNSQLHATFVPNYFIDTYMSEANGEFVKIYLYLLRCMSTIDSSISISKIADKFDHTEKDIKRALKYWEKVNLLKLEYDEDRQIIGICLLENQNVSQVEVPDRQIEISKQQGDTPEHLVIQEQSSKKIQIKEVETPVIEEKATKRPSYSKNQLQSFVEDDDIKQLIFITEQYMGKILNPTDMMYLYFWSDDLKLSVDLIEYLVEYCVCKGHKNIRYIDKVALRWAEDGITTVQQAKESVQVYNKNHSGVMKAFGIQGRSLVDAEKDFIQKWLSQYGYALEVIIEACTRTMQVIHQPSFEYADSILGRWHEKGVKNLSDIIPLDEQHKKLKETASVKKVSTPVANRFNNFQQRTYNYDKLEQQLLNRSLL